MVSVKRDAQEKNGEVIANFNYYIQYRIVNDAHYEQQINMLMKNMLMMINQINQNDKFKDIEVPKYITDKINLISVQDLAKQFPTLTLEEALKYYVNLNGLTFIKGVYQQLPNGKRLLIGSPTMDDYANSTILYVFNKVTNNIVPIIKISSKPDKEKIKQQIILDTPNALKEQIYEKTVLNKKINFPSSINIKIYFSNLMLLNLSKMHLCEVIHSPCSEDLLKYFKENEIEVM
jgi:asparagine synthetase A